MCILFLRTTLARSLLSKLTACPWFHSNNWSLTARVLYYGVFLLLSLVSHSLFFLSLSLKFLLSYFLARGLISKGRLFEESKEGCLSFSWIMQLSWEWSRHWSFVPNGRVAGLHCVWFKGHLKLHTPILVMMQSSLRFRIDRVWGALKSLEMNAACRRYRWASEPVGPRGLDFSLC